MSARRRFRAAAALLVAACGAGGILLPLSADAATSSGLLSISCTHLRTDPALEAPLYAQKEGASGATDGWWCQLPHATAMPPGDVEERRLAAPLAYPYTLYSTYYGPKGNAGNTFVSSDAPLVVTVDWDSTVIHQPHALIYPKLFHAKGQPVSLAKGIEGTVVTSKNGESVTWRFSRKNTAPYLSGVATVTVTGNGVPLSTVLSVARAVKPN